MRRIAPFDFASEVDDLAATAQMPALRRTLPTRAADDDIEEDSLSNLLVNGATGESSDDTTDIDGRAAAPGASRPDESGARRARPSSGSSTAGSPAAPELRAGNRVGSGSRRGWPSLLAARPSAMVACCAVLGGLGLALFQGVHTDPGRTPTPHAAGKAASTDARPAPRPPAAPVSPPPGPVALEHPPLAPAGATAGCGASTPMAISVAADHLIAGRMMDAERAYATLSRCSAFDPALTVVAKLLARATAPGCSPSEASAPCPEVKR